LEILLGIKKAKDIETIRVGKRGEEMLRIGKRGEEKVREGKRILLVMNRVRLKRMW
jgi:hypothetical protein